MNTTLLYNCGIEYGNIDCDEENYLCSSNLHDLKINAKGEKNTMAYVV